MPGQPQPVMSRPPVPQPMPSHAQPMAHPQSMPIPAQAMPRPHITPAQSIVPPQQQYQTAGTTQGSEQLYRASATTTQPPTQVRVYVGILDHFILGRGVPLTTPTPGWEMGVVMGILPHPPQKVMVYFIVH